VCARGGGGSNATGVESGVFGEEVRTCGRVQQHHGVADLAAATHRVHGVLRWAGGWVGAGSRGGSSLGHRDNASG
jgi:hypothetical protein